MSAAHAHPSEDRICFHRTELSMILSLYGRMVAAGEWHDYAITIATDHCSFAIFRQGAALPLYRVEKWPALRLKQGQFMVLGAQSQILRRGHELRACLRVLDRKLIRPVT